MRPVESRGLAVAATIWLLAAGAAHAQIAVSANDGKVRLVNGKVEYQKDGQDTVSIIDLAASPPKVLHEIAAGASVEGPPFSVALTPGEELALVAVGKKAEGDPPTGVSDDRLLVIDLKRHGSLIGTLTKKVKDKLAKQNAEAAVPEVIATVQVGKGAAGIAINRAGTLALVANRDEGTVSVLSIDVKAKKVTAQPEKVKVGGEKSGPSGIAITPDGKTALVTRDAEHRISVLRIEGDKVTATGQELAAGIRPYSIDISSKGDYAAVGNTGAGFGDADTISVIDLKANPIRVVSTVTVGATPEGIKLSRDGQFLAVVLVDGTNKAKDHPAFRENGTLQVWRFAGKELTKVGEVPIGKWCQGAAWSRNGKKLLVQCMVEEEILVFNVTGVVGKKIEKAGAIKVKGGPAGIRTAEK